jgi:hypothetical protein
MEAVAFVAIPDVGRGVEDPYARFGSNWRVTVLANQVAAATAADRHGRRDHACFRFPDPRGQFGTAASTAHDPR